MAKSFFYCSTLILWVVLITVARTRPLKLYHLFLWLIYSLYSLCFEAFFGEVLKLYYYIAPNESILYILLGSLFLYPLTAVLYVLLYPKKMVLWYTVGWIALLQGLEIASIYTRTIVLTGWRIIPWSPLVYLLTFLFICLLNKALKKVVKDQRLLNRT